MQSDLPWNISGIPTDAREAARAAARREGLSTGEWLTRRIIQMSNGEQPALPPETGDMLNRLAEQAEGEAQTIAGLQQAISTLQQQISDLSATQTNTLQQEIADLRAAQDAAAHSAAPESQPGPATDQMMEIGQALSEQLNSVLRFQQDFAEQTNAKIAVLAGTMAQMQKEKPATDATPAADPAISGQIAHTLEQTDGRISALSDSFVSLSGSMDLLRRDFREAMEELGTHLGDFDERLQQFEESFMTPAPETAMPEPEALPDPQPEPAPEPEPEAAPAPTPAPVTAQPAAAPRPPAKSSSFAFDRVPGTDKPEDMFSAEERHEAAGIKDEFSPDAKLDVPWHSDEYEAEDEEDERSRRKVLIFLRIVLVFAVLLAAAAAFMAYHHIGFNELKGYITHTQTAAPAQPHATTPPPAHSNAADLAKLEKLAKNGDSQAMLLLGVTYADGTGVPPDPKKALHWLEQAGSAGEAIAQYRLGVLYEGGHGTEAAPDKAAEQFALAAKAGNLQAMYLLASAYDTGTGVSTSAAEAAHWYGKAANYGLADAAFNLAQLYEQGNGVSADPVMAYQWYAIAAAGGDTDAAPHLEDLKARLSATDLTRAGEAARAFKPDAAPVDANMVPDIAKVLQKAG